MKRALILLILTAVIPFVYGVSFDKLNDVVYNLGDNIQLTGVLDNYGILNLELLCNANSIVLGTITVIDGSFSRLIPLTSLTGDCNIKGKLNDLNGIAVQEISTENFKVSNELTGEFYTAYDNLQLGDSLKITGSVKNLNNEPVDGVAIFSIKKGNDIYLVESAEIKKGDILFSTNLALIPAGDYSADIEVSDNFGNRKFFGNALMFKVFSKLSIAADLDKNVYLPGNEMILDVSIIKGSGGNASKLFTAIDIEGNKYNQTVSNFRLKYKIPGNVKSYNHSIFINSWDNSGNTGDFMVIYSIEPVATEIRMNLSSEDINPGSDLSVVVDVLDQANDFMKEKLKIDLVEGNNVVETKEEPSSEDVKFNIDKFAKPGIRKIKAEYLNLKIEKLFTVNEVKVLKTNLEGQELVLYNDGNVIYDNDLIIKADSTEVVKKLYLGINKTVKVDLANYFSEGNYTFISVENTGDVFNDIEIRDERGIADKVGSGLTSITGEAVLSPKSVGVFKLGFYYVSFIVAILAFTFIVIFGMRSLKNYREKDRKTKEYAEGQKKLRELTKEVKKNKIDFGKYSQEDIKDWRDRTMRGYEETNRAVKKQENKSVYDSRDNNTRDSNSRGNGGNAFSNMFG